MLVAVIRPNYGSLSTLMKSDKGTVTCSEISGNDFLKFFENKVSDVRGATGHSAPVDVLPPVATNFETLHPCTAEEVRRRALDSPVNSCTLDPIPTFLLREMIDILLPFITRMCNASLLEGYLPLSQRHAIVPPILKKSKLDAEVLENYRTVSNLTFVSKVIERMVANQVTYYLQSNNLMPERQSAYCRHHSTETASLRVVSDIATAADSGLITLLGPLDLSSAFDTVNTSILLRRLRSTFRITGLTLSWIESFLCDRTQQVCFNGSGSTTGRLSSGVRQGSVLGPLLFILYTAELFKIIRISGLMAHSYADDTQIYLSIASGRVQEAVNCLFECVSCVDE